LDACLLPIEAGLASFPRIELDVAQARRLGQGQRLPVEEATPEQQVAIFDETGRVLGLGEIDGDRVLRPGRLFTWTTEAAARPSDG
jgi:tRNA pseudouridine55 synthase